MIKVVYCGVALLV